MANVYLSISKVQWHQSSWKIPSGCVQVEVTAQSIIHGVRSVCVAQCCAHVIAMKILNSIGDQDVLSDYDDDDENDNDSE